MNMRKNVIDIYNSIINNEDILRLLIYTPIDLKNPDDPLDPNKPNILDMNAEEKFDLIDKHVLKTPKTSELTVENRICRLCMYPAKRRSGNSSYAMADQDIVFDIYVHYDIDHADLRMAWICDYINNFVYNSRITGIGSIRFFDGNAIFNAPKGYSGYSLIYRFGSVK